MLALWAAGEDAHSGISFEHRRGWIRDRLFQLADVFAIDVAGYAVMSNHYHLVLSVSRDEAEAWTGDDVIDRWHRVFAGNLFSSRHVAGEKLLTVERKALDVFIAMWRQRLMDISWFMRCLNEDIARKANSEDGCTGRFWEGRFKSQALLDENALAACLAYVDLNPVRSAMAETPEASDFTGVQERGEAARRASAPNEPEQQPARLLPFAGNPREEMPKGQPFRATDYLALVDWTGRQMREGKRGAIDSALRPILDRLQIDPKHWLYMTEQSESRFKGSSVPLIV